jgi:cold shock CspA family protein
MADRKTGYLKWFDDKKGYEFITLEGQEDGFTLFLKLIWKDLRY